MAEQPKVPAASADPTKPRSSRADVLDFLDSLDSYSAPPRSGSTPVEAPIAGATPSAAPNVTNAEDAQSVLDFLDEITQRSSTPTAPVRADPALSKKVSVPSSLSRSGSRTNVLAPSTASTSRRSGESVRSTKSASSELASPPQVQAAEAVPVAEEGGWGWSSVWSQATNVVQQASQVVQQARTVAEEQVKTASGGAGLGGIGQGLMKALGENEQAKKWSEGAMEYARGAHLDQLGKDLKTGTLRSLTELLNAVAPPIAEHEVIQVSLSHDMVGYEGVETLVYRGLTKIMDQIEGGTLIINQGDEAKPKGNAEVDPDERNLNYVEGLAEGWKLAEANLAELIKNSFKPEVTPENNDGAESLTVPVTHCPIFLRIQPCLAPLPFYASPSPSDDPNSTPTAPSNALFFLLLLRDPTHNLVHSSLSQSIPAAWLDIPFEENEWVEDVMVDVIRASVEVVGQEYITQRLRGRNDLIQSARAAAQGALDQHAEEKAVAVEPASEEEVATAAASSQVGV